MRVGFVQGGIPGLSQSGSTLAAWTILEQLLARGHEVTAVLCPAPELLDDDTPARLDALERLGVSVRLVEIPPPRPPRTRRWRAREAFVRTLAWPRADELFPAARAAPAVEAAVTDSDAVAAFGIEAIVASANASSTRALAALSHPPGVSRRLRLRYAPPTTLSGRAGELSFLAHADRRAARTLRRFASVAVFSATHARWARTRGVNAWYAHYPMPDLAGAAWRDRRSRAKPNPKPRILMIGHLRGIGTISGLHLFVPSVLPRLTEALGVEGFEVHVVGGHDPPAEFRDALEHPAVRLRGQIAEPAEEFFASDVLLAPNPTTTGASARILSGLTFGSCIVAHTDSLVGIPELAHGENCLLAGDGPTLADQTLRALADAELRQRVGDAGRALYERAFSPPVAAGSLVDELERLAQR